MMKIQNYFIRQSNNSRQLCSVLLMFVMAVASTRFCEGFFPTSAFGGPGIVVRPRSRNQQQPLWTGMTAIPAMNGKENKSMIVSSSSSLSGTPQSMLHENKSQRGLASLFMKSILERTKRILFKRRRVLLLLFIATCVLTPMRVMAATTVATSSSSSAAVSLLLEPPVPRDVELRLTFRIVYAALLGAVLGKERSQTNHSAGVRTMALVSMGAAAFTICSIFGFPGHHDTSRMASSVASGVGFVGAGVITTSASPEQHSVVRGLTTAAAIWISAAIGVTCGAGLHFIATSAAAGTIAILSLGRKKPKNQQRFNGSSALSSRSSAFSQNINNTGLRSGPSTTKPPKTPDHNYPQEHMADIHVTKDWDEQHEQHEDYDDYKAPTPAFESHEHSHDNDVILDFASIEQRKPKETRKKPNLEKKAHKTSQEWDDGSTSKKQVTRPRRIPIPDQDDRDIVMAEVVRHAWANSTAKDFDEYVGDFAKKQVSEKQKSASHTKSHRP